MTDKVTLLIKFLAYISEDFGSNIGRNMAIVTDSLRDFSQYLQITVKIVPRIGHDRFLINPFKLVTH
jgi:hypothetical protein